VTTSTTTAAPIPVPGHPRYLIDSDGNVRGARGWILRAHTVKGGYKRVTIDGRHRLVHVLVAAAFLGPKPAGHQVNHKDGDKANKAAYNLEYLTPSANVRHSIEVLHTTRAPGSRNANAKLTEAVVREMRAAYASGASFTELAVHHQIHPTTAHRIVTRRTWRHV